MTTTNQPLLKCLVIDDEPLARRAIVDFIVKVDFLEATNSCASAIEALELIERETFDLIFLDINMPYLSGIEFLETLSNPPLVIFTTAYSEHALEGYRFDIVDYLLKPIDFKRFYQASLKAKQLYILKSEKTNQVATDSFVYVRQDDSFIKIDWNDLLFVEGMQNYLKLQMIDKSLVIHQTMTTIEELLPKQSFFRIHKSYLININHISSISGTRLFINEKQLPISRMRKEELLKQVVYKKLLSR